MDNSTATLWEKCKALLFHLFPHHLLSRLTYWATRRRSFLVTYAIKIFIRHFSVDMHDAQKERPDEYATFNEFFTRQLKASARSIDADSKIIVSPCDGIISMHGNINNETLLQAKNKTFSLHDFCTPESKYYSQFKDGTFCTIYLSPRDYHRVHIPCDARLLEMVYIPGRLFSVAPYAPKTINKLFARNERIIPVFSLANGLMAVAMVGAVNVAAIEMVWSGLVTPPHQNKILRVGYEDNPNPVTLNKGDHMGTFNMGSTVVILFSRNCVTALGDVKNGSRIQMGQAIYRFN